MTSSDMLSRDTVYRQIGQTELPDEFPFDDFTLNDFDSPENPLCDSAKLKHRKRLSVKTRHSFSALPEDMDTYTISVQNQSPRSSSAGTSPRLRNSEPFADFNMPKFHPDQLPPPSMTATTPVTKRPRAKSLTAIFSQAASSSNARLIASHTRSRLSAPLIDALADKAVESDLPSELAVQRSSYDSTFASLNLQRRIKESVGEDDPELTDEEDLLLN